MIWLHGLWIPTQTNGTIWINFRLLRTGIGGTESTEKCVWAAEQERGRVKSEKLTGQDKK